MGLCLRLDDSTQGSPSVAQKPSRKLLLEPSPFHRPRRVHKFEAKPSQDKAQDQDHPGKKNKETKPWAQLRLERSPILGPGPLLSSGVGSGLKSREEPKPLS